MWKKSVCFVVAAAVLAAVQVSAEASVQIVEFLADPPSGPAGDANLDGVRSSSSDEFIEIYNSGPETVNISGWSLSDSVRERHVFPNNTFLSPRSLLVVFGGGSPAIAGDWQRASSGTLGLNNSGDRIVLTGLYGAVLDRADYGSEGGDNQSLVLFDGEFVLHTDHPLGDGALFSPGEHFDQESGRAVVPEFTSFTYLMFAFGLSRFKRRKQKFSGAL